MSQARPRDRACRRVADPRGPTTGPSTPAALQPQPSPPRVRALRTARGQGRFVLAGDPANSPSHRPSGLEARRRPMRARRAPRRSMFAAAAMRRPHTGPRRHPTHRHNARVPTGVGGLRAAQDASRPAAMKGRVPQHGRVPARQGLCGTAASPTPPPPFQHHRRRLFNTAGDGHVGASTARCARPCASPRAALASGLGGAAFCAWPFRSAAP